MPAEKTSLVDNLVRGAFQFMYDFFGMTIAGLSIPFLNRSRRLWHTVLTAQKRLSPLTFFFLWVLITLTLVWGLPANTIAPNLLGVDKEPNFQFLRLVVQAFIIAAIVDLLLRAVTSRIQNSVKRKLYRPLLRITLGCLFFGCGMTFFLGQNMQIDMNYLLFFRGFGSQLFVELYAAHLFALPFAIIANKAFSVAKPLSRLLVGLPLVLLVPILAVNLSAQVLLNRFWDVTKLFPNTSVRLLQSNTTCNINKAGQIEVDAFVRLRNSKGIVFKEDIIGVMNGDKLIGRGVAGHSDVMLSDSAFTKVHLTAKPEQKIPPESELRKGSFECDLVLLEAVTDYDNELTLWNETDTEAQ